MLSIISKQQQSLGITDPSTTTPDYSLRTGPLAFVGEVGGIAIYNREGIDVQLLYIIL